MARHPAASGSDEQRSKHSLVAAVAVSRISVWRTFPGMMEEPGAIAGRLISLMPARGPDESNCNKAAAEAPFGQYFSGFHLMQSLLTRKSLHIFEILTAMRLPTDRSAQQAHNSFGSVRNVNSALITRTDTELTATRLKMP